MVNRFDPEPCADASYIHSSMMRVKRRTCEPVSVMISRRPAQSGDVAVFAFQLGQDRQQVVRRRVM